MAKLNHWLDEVLDEARTILLDFCDDNGVAGGRGIAKSVLDFARDPAKPITEFALFVAVDALGDHQSAADTEMDILFQFLRWAWWAVKFRELPKGQTLKRPHEVESEFFRRRKPGSADNLRPSDN